MNPDSKQKIIFGSIVLVGLVVCLALVRTCQVGMFKSVCEKNSEDALIQSGYRTCPSGTAGPSQKLYCDLRQLPVPANAAGFDRCIVDTTTKTNTFIEGQK